MRIQNIHDGDAKHEVAPSDVVDEADEESFPASDTPAWTAATPGGPHRDTSDTVRGTDDRQGVAMQSSPPVVAEPGTDGTRNEAWPALSLDAWRDTYATLHLWTQIVGKTRLAFAPMQNHWWQVAFYVTSRGMTTSSIPYGTRTFDVDFDFIDHVLVIHTSDASTRTIPLVARPVSEFYREYVAALRALRIDVHLWPMPVEIAGGIPFTTDDTHASYDADAVNRFWRALVQADRVLEQFRGRFIGKASPVHFFWGSFDLAATRFSGRRAPEYQGSVPNLAPRVMREAYSHEVISAGFWPGGDAVPEAAFYAYAYPEPAGLADATILPRGAYYHHDMREFILPYEAVRTATAPEERLLEFLETTYDTAADLARWDRAALERQPAARG